MEFLRQRAGQLKAAWDQLSGSGRLVIGLAALLVVAVILLVAQGAGSPELSPLPTNFGPEELTRAAATLTANGVKNEVRGNQIFVVADKRSQCIGLLSASEALPADKGINFEELVSTTDIWATDRDKDRKWRVALKKELEKCILAMPGVKGVSVNINYGQESFRPTPEGVSASISVRSARDEPIQKDTAIAMANLVAGAVNGLTREKVKVIDATHKKSFDLSEPGGGGSSDYIPKVKEYEAHFDGKLREQFKYIEALVVNVHVKPTIDFSTEQSYKVDNAAVIEGGTTNRNSSTTAGSIPAVPGVITNVGSGPGTGTAGAGAAADTTSEETIQHAVDYGRTVSSTTKPAGEIKQITAAILVPRSYFVKIAQLEARDPKKEIDDAALKKVMEVETPKIEKQARTIIGAPATDLAAVQVDMYYDVPADRVADSDAAGSGFATVAMGLLGSYGPSAGLGLLAILALLMVYNVVRKVQPVSIPAEPTQTSSEQVAEAGLTLDSILEGVELEADTIRASKMQEQISNMIKEDPENVAGLVKRWLAQQE